MRHHTNPTKQTRSPVNSLSESDRVSELRGQIRKILFENEAAEATPGTSPVDSKGTAKPGTAAVDSKGTLNVKKIADTLGVDAAKLSAAVKSSAQGKKRTPVHNAILGDVFVKLMNASPEDTVKAMNAFKAVSAEKGGKNVKK